MGRFLRQNQIYLDPLAGVPISSHITPPTNASAILLVLRSKRIFYGLVCCGTERTFFGIEGISPPLIMTMREFKLYLKWFAVAKRNKHSSQWDSPDRLSQSSRHCWWTNAWVPLQLHGDSKLEICSGIYSFHLSFLHFGEWIKCRLHCNAQSQKQTKSFTSELLKNSN